MALAIQLGGSDTLEDRTPAWRGPKKGSAKGPAKDQQRDTEETRSEPQKFS